MKKTLTFALLTSTCFLLSGQNQFFFNHYMMNPSFINPAWVGSDNIASLSFQYRSQWTGYTTSFDGSGGAPGTQMISLVIPVMNFPISGLGVNVSNDNLGPLTNQQVQFSASFSRQLRSGEFRFGIMPGIYSQTMDFGQLRFVEPEPKYQGGVESQFRPSVNTGIYFQTNNKFSIGLSVINLVESSFDFSRDSLENRLERSYYLNMSKPIRVNDDMTIIPSAIFRSDLTRVTFDINTLVTYKQKMWTGISYRLEESLILFLGYSLLKDNSLKIGYSFDYVIHDRDAKQATSNEIFVRYNLPNLIFGGRKSIKTPRFAF